MYWRIDDERGQAAVEAAFALPLFLLVLGLVLQPALLLYNRCVMYSAAAQGCRLLETQAVDEAAARMYIVRRLAAVPHADVFHCGGDDGWGIELAGSGGSGPVGVTIMNKSKALPLFGVSAGLAASVDESGMLVQSVSVTGQLWPDWAQESGVGPQGLADEWE